MHPVACPKGSYCPAGSVSHVPCPTGTFSSATSLSSAADCEPCPAGYECAVPCACAVCPFSRSGLGWQVSSSPAVKKPIAKKFERELGKLRGQ